MHVIILLTILMYNILLIKIIQFIHILLILYIILGPFILPKHTKNIISILLLILYRWITNNDTCTLTTIENKLTNNNNGFIYRIISPIYNIRESTFNKQLYIISILLCNCLCCYINS